MKKKKYIDWYQKVDDVTACLKKECKCGHRKLVPYSSKYEYVLCNWCGARLYYDDNKQQEWDKKVAKENFIFNLNKCIEEKNIEDMLIDKIRNKKNLKRKYFKTNEEYLVFCKDSKIQIYIVDTKSSKTGNIIVYYGAKMGRPKKDNSIKPKKYRYKYYKNSKYRLYQ